VILVTAIDAQEVVVVTVVIKDAVQDLEVILEVKETQGKIEVGAGLGEVVETTEMGEVTREETEANQEKTAATPEEKGAGVGADQSEVEKTPRMGEVTREETEATQEKNAVTPEEKGARVGVGPREVEKTSRMREVAQKKTEVIQKSAAIREGNEARVIPVTSLDQEVGANPADTEFSLFNS